MTYRAGAFGAKFGYTCCYVIASAQGDDALVVDPGEGSEEWVQSALGDHTARAVLLTHAHMDHTWAAQPLANRLGVPVLLADAGHAAMEEPELALPGGFPPDLLAGHPRRRPEQLSAPDARFSVGAMTVQTIATPGHTADSVGYVIEVDGSRLVCTGDTLLGQGNAGTPVPPGGDSLQLQSSLTSLARQLAGATVLPGHGSPFPSPSARDWQGVSVL